MPRPTPYWANMVLSLARIFAPSSGLPSSSTASPCTNLKVAVSGSAGQAPRGAHQPRAPSPGASHASISPPDMVTPSRFSLMV